MTDLRVVRMALIGCLVAAPLPLDTEAAPSPHVVVGRHGKAYVRFDVPRRVGFDVSQCQVTAYRVGSDGEDELLWREQGWYAFEAWLSGDGKSLARLGNWSRGSGPAAGDLAVAFHAEGRLLRSYSTRDLVKDDSKVGRSVSHYMWLKESRFDDSWDGERLELVTMDDMAYTFDLRTGEIVEQVQLRPSSWSTPEPHAEEWTLAVSDAVNAYYDTLSARDWPALAAHFHTGAVLSTRWTPPGAEQPEVMMSSVAEFVARAPEGPGSQPIFEETPTALDVRRSGDMAVAWVTYRVRFGKPDALQEWGGVDAITLLRHEGRWRITSLAWAGD